jgi:hypothetical protein
MSLVRWQPYTVDECTVAAPQIPQFERCFAAAPDSRMAPTDAHTIACKRCEIDIRHGAGRRVAPTKDDLWLGLEQDRLRTYDLNLQRAIFGEHIGGRAIGDV